MTGFTPIEAIQLDEGRQKSLGQNVQKKADIHDLIIVVRGGVRRQAGEF